MAVAENRSSGEFAIDDKSGLDEVSGIMQGQVVSVCRFAGRPQNVDNHRRGETRHVDESQGSLHGDGAFRICGVDARTAQLQAGD